MSENPAVQEFLAISNDYGSKPNITPEDAAEAVGKMKNIDFLSFNLNEIKLVQETKWLPDDFTVDIFKKWMRQQDRLLLQMRAYLVFHPKVKKECLVQFAEATQNPSRPVDLVVKDILHRIATAGGSRDFVNPFDQRLIVVKQSIESNSSHSLSNLFDGRNDTYYVSQAQKDISVIISLPPFLKANLTSYVLKGPPELGGRAQGGPSSWILQGLNKADDTQDAVQIDLQKENADLAGPNSEKEFIVKQVGYFSHFRFLNTGSNHQGNFSIILRGIDFNGTLMICRD